ncbi:MAG: 1,2-phenylacetyl-CoA epoxidase subunit PaaC [Actinomycetota bacterium]
MSALREFLLAFADDEHLMGQQHTEWIGVAPFLEEDLAFSSIGQDELGHAVLLYELALELDGAEATDAAVDALAYRADGYRSAALAEYVTTDWAEALVRHWIHDAAEHLRWTNVAASSHTPLASIVDRVEREERFHRLHADTLLDTLLATAEPRQRVTDALSRLAPMVPSILTSVAGEDELVTNGVIAQRTDELVPALAAAIEQRFSVDVSVAAPSPGREERSEPFVALMARMREVFDYDPEAVW